MKSTSEQQTYAIAADFATQLKGGELVALVGDLGSGKTTFVRGVVEALGSTVRVKSPTFTIMNEYPILSHPERRPLDGRVEGSAHVRSIIHIDLYRFKDPKHLEGIALEDVMRDDTVVFVEWPDVFGERFDLVSEAKRSNLKTYEIRFRFVDETTRDITIV